MKTDKGSIADSIPQQFTGKWREVEKSKIEVDLLLLEVSDKSAVLTMKSLPGASKTYDFQKVLQSSDKELKVKCSLPDVTLEFEIKGDLLYTHETFPPPSLRTNIYYVYERY
jgi:hypothetical protein